MSNLIKILVLIFVFGIPLNAQAEMSKEQYLAKLKGFRETSDKLVAEYEQKKQASDKEFHKAFNSLGDTPQDQARRKQMILDAQKNQKQMQAQLKTKLDAIKKEENALRVARGDRPVGLSKLERAALSSSGVEDFETRKKRQDEIMSREKQNQQVIERAAAAEKRKLDRAKDPVATPSVSFPDTSGQESKKYERKKVYGDQPFSGGSVKY